MRLGEVAVFNYGQSLPKQRRILGDVPVFSSAGLIGKHNEPLVKEPGIIIGRKGTAGSVYKSDISFFPIDTTFYISERNTKCDLHFLYYLLKNLGLNSLNSDSAVPGLNRNIAYAQDIKIPPLAEQKAIASLLETWDTAIEKTEALIAAKKKQFEWLVNSLINKSDHKMTRLLNFIEEVSIRNKDNQLDRVLSVTNHSGFVLPEEQFERRVASSNVSNYKIVKRSQYAYNPARINVGSIARLDNWHNGIISPMYTVFKLNPEKIENDYFLYWLSSDEAKQRIKNSEQGSVRKTVSFDSLSIIPIALPDIKKQKAITQILNTAQQEITLLKQLTERYRIQKRGLMQKLLTAKWRLI